MLLLIQILTVGGKALNIKRVNNVTLEKSVLPYKHFFTHSCAFPVAQYHSVI